MKKYTMNDFITGKVAVRVNKSNMMDFLKMCEEKGIVWESGDKATKCVCCEAKIIACGFGSANRLTFSVDANSTLYSDAGYTFVDFSQIIKPVCHQIIIESDGDTTTAKMLVNGKEVKQATAKRNPADKANWRTGAQVAFDRLWQKQPKPEKPEEKANFKVGDRVVCVGSLLNNNVLGEHGRIVAFSCFGNVGVEFDKNVNGHALEGFGVTAATKNGHCWWCSPDSLCREQPTKPGRDA